MARVRIAAGIQLFPQLFDRHRIFADEPLPQVLDLARAAQRQTAHAFVRVNLGKDMAIVGNLRRSQPPRGESHRALGHCGPGLVIQRRVRL